MIADRGLSRYLSATRHLKRVDPSDALAQRIQVMCDDMKVHFNVGERFGERVNFLQIHSAQKECEMLDSTMLVDLNFIRLMLELNLLTSASVNDETLGCRSADRLAEAYASCGDYAGVLAVLDVSAPWLADKRPLDAGKEELELLLMQVHFLLIHESFHWVLSKHENLQAGATAMFDQQLRPAVSRHADNLLNPEKVRWSMVGPRRVEETVDYLNAIGHEVDVWIGRSREELICDYWAVDGMIGPMRDPAVIGRALLAGAAVHAALGCRDYLGDLAAGRDMSGAVGRGFFGSASAAARFVLFRGLCEAVCIERNKSFDRAWLEGEYPRLLAGVERLIAAADRLNQFVRRRAAHAETVGADIDLNSQRDRALQSLGYGIAP